MQAPVLVFDHVKKQTVVLLGASAEKRLAEVGLAQSQAQAPQK